MDAQDITLAAGSFRRIETQFDPETAETPVFHYLAADEKVASVTPQGVITAKAPGQTVIFVVCDNVEEAVRITVNVTE